MKNEELSLEELDNILAGTSFEVASKKALNNGDAYRKEQIEELKKQKDFLENLNKKQEQTEQISMKR